MKRLTGLLLGLLFLSSVIAVEGMWIPLFLDKYNIEDMQKMGLKIGAEDIYSINNTSLKDAIVIFGRGCTGSVISPDGLVITNHHCAYRIIQGHSTLENDIVTNGFWAESRSDEISNPGLTVTFLVRMEDVTEKVLEGVEDGMTESQRESIITTNSKDLVEQATEDNHFKAEVKPFFQGNQFFLVVNEVFEDVRLVGAPPSSIGKFGGDTDNWMWPRHTGDFALFRIYTAPDGTPAEYSQENIPLQAKKHIPISTQGVNKGDFTFVFGYPGSTMQYLPSYAVEQILHQTYPNRILVREKKLDVLNAAMDSDHSIRLQYTAKAASTSNAWKKWIGEIRGLNRLDAINVKKQHEKELMKWVNESDERIEKYGNILSEYKRIYEEIAPYSLAFYYINEAGFGTEAIQFASRLRGFEQISKDRESIIPVIKEDAESRAESHFRDYHTSTDEKVFAAMVKVYYENIPERFHPAFFDKLERLKRRSDNPFIALAENKYENSIIVCEQKFSDFLEGLNHRSVRRLINDPIYNAMQDIRNVYFDEIYPKYSYYNNQLDSLHRIYMQAQMDFEEEKIFYPDANFTMRITFGQIDTYYPADGVKYGYYTTLSGIIEKENPDVYDYKVHDRLKELYYAEDFGDYHTNGEMRVCFIASNHTTGGNSGSPVLNANGELIGVNFDRNWEGTMSDIMYDPDMCRNISIDIRYALFIIDKFAGAKHIIEELDLR